MSVQEDSIAGLRETSLLSRTRKKKEEGDPARQLADFFDRRKSPLKVQKSAALQSQCRALIEDFVKYPALALAGATTDKRHAQYSQSDDCGVG